jgi:hypothetical protein
VRGILLAGALALIVFSLCPLAASAAIYDEPAAAPVAEPAAVAEALAVAEAMVPGPGPCAAPVTKSYRIKQGFCPQALVRMIPGAVGPDCCCGGGCGPYGIPPIYAAGQYVMVRQSLEMHERVKEFLTDLGALAEAKKPVY